GLPESNEIVVTATVGALRIGIAGPSSLVYPAMIDCIFGPDADDVTLAAQLSERLWGTHSTKLIAETMKVRQSTDK
ncbi:hypothetical protein ABTM84_19350, partial [Acinetobacter baumannii]